jgi:hypothetical protein
VNTCRLPIGHSRRRAVEPLSTPRGRTAVARQALVAMIALAARPSAQKHCVFDLDVPSARSSCWGIDDLGSATRVDAEREVRELRRPRMQPTACGPCGIVPALGRRG